MKYPFILARGSVPTSSALFYYRVVTAIDPLLKVLYQLKVFYLFYGVWRIKLKFYLLLSKSRTYSYSTLLGFKVNKRTLSLPTLLKGGVYPKLFLIVLSSYHENFWFVIYLLRTLLLSRNQFGSIKYYYTANKPSITSFNLAYL